MTKRHSEETKQKIRASKAATLMKRQSQTVRCYELKLVEKRLNALQREKLNLMFLEGKRFYNHVLAFKNENQAYLSDINPASVKEATCLDKDGNKVKFRLDNLPSHFKQTIHARMQANEKTIRILFKKGLQKHGSLKFKSELSCIPLKSGDWKFRSARKVWILGIKGSVLVKGTDQIPAECDFANANLIRKPDGCYLKVTCYISRENFKEKPKNGKEIGLDFGIKTNITTSEGEKLDMQVEESDRLKKLQKEMFRRAKGSNNRHKTVKLIQREYQKLSNKKEDTANKIVSKLKAYSCICMQDEQIHSWHKGLFGKQIQHSCLGRIKQKLKALPQTVVLDKFIPTTKWCPSCGKKNAVSLADRTYSCSCGYHEDRDVHSAKNMLAIKNLVFGNQSVPMEHREVTLTEFKASIREHACGIESEPRRGSEKIASFKA